MYKIMSERNWVDESYLSVLFQSMTMNLVLASNIVSTRDNLSTILRLVSQ